MDERRLHGAAARDLAGDVGTIIQRQDDRQAAAHTAARASLLALMYLIGPKETALIAYRLADEMADAAGRLDGGAG